VEQTGDESLQDALSFVAGHPHVFLTATRADGYPTAYAMNAQVRDGAVQFSTYRASAKVRNIVRDGRAGLVVVDDETGTTLSARGTAELVTGDEWLRDGGTRGGRAPTAPAEIVDKVAERHRSGKRVVLKLTLTEARFSTPPGERT
jgi:hypothetical protein